MKRHLCNLFLSALFIILGTSCAAPTKPASQPAAEPRPAYTENFIALHLKADPQLNLYQGTSHALHVCVYQLTDPNAFNQLSEEEMGLSKLMNCERFDAGVALSKRLIIQPGEDRIFQVDRAEGARYVGIVAGYYMLQKRNVVRLYRIPTTGEAVQGATQKPFNIDLYLAPQMLRETGERP